jgi:hypothetical protein
MWKRTYVIVVELEFPNQRKKHASIFCNILCAQYCENWCKKV